jgi:4-amino-4-deoxy-L-arabinose transferase-like glycosyltransferase
MPTPREMQPTAPPERLHFPLLLVLAILGRAHVPFAPDALVLGWRQADMLSVTRNFARHGYRLFWPQIDWGGAGPGYVEMEFPLLPWLGALLQRLFGPYELLPALLPLFASFGLVFAIAAVARRILGPAAAFWAGAFAAVSPMTAWYTATFIPDGTMVLSSVLGVLFLLRWAATQRLFDLVLSGAFTSLAVLLKPTALLVGLPLLDVFALAWGRTVPKRPAFWLYGALVLLPSCLWYAHAHGLYLEYGNTFGVLKGGYEKLSSLALLVNPVFWLRIAGRTALYLLTPAVAVLWAIGLARRPAGAAGRLFHVWTAGAFVYVVVVGRGNFEMQHYQLPLLPPAAALAGAAFADLAGRLGRDRPARAVRFGAFLLLVLTIFGATLVHGRRVIANTLADARRQRENGRAVARVTPPNSLILVTTGYGGSRKPGEIDTPPEVFAHGDRRGWFVGLHWLTSDVVAARRADGARALVVPGEALPSFMGREADALRARYPALPAGPDVLVLDLATPDTPAPVITR